MTQSFTLPNDGRSISWNVASLNILVHDVINLLYYEHWTDKQKYFYVSQVEGAEYKFDIDILKFCVNNPNLGDLVWKLKSH